MPPSDTPLDSTPAFPPVVRLEPSPVQSGGRLPALRPSSDVPLATVALAAGLALAVEGFRFLARSNRRRSSARRSVQEQSSVTVSYQWTQVVYERREHR